MTGLPSSKYTPVALYSALLRSTRPLVLTITPSLKKISEIEIALLSKPPGLFRKSIIKPEFALILDSHAKFLIDNTDKSVTIEGHTDEKGTPEYNIALGERRALAVSNYLQNMGVAENQITVVSYGEEKPANFGHSETALAENRRAELVY